MKIIPKKKCLTDKVVLKVYFKIGNFIGVFPWDSNHKRLKLLYKMVISLLAFAGMFTIFVPLQDKIDPILKISYFGIFLMYLIFGLSSFYETIRGKEEYLQILRNFGEVDRVLRNANINVTFEIKRSVQILIIIINYTGYLFSNSLYLSEAHGYISLLQHSYYVIIFYQMDFMVLSYWYICQLMQKRIDTLLEILINLSQPQANDKFLKIRLRKIIAVKECYKHLSDIIEIMNSFYGKFLLIIILVTFFYIMLALTFIIFFFSYIDGDNIFFFPGCIRHMVSMLKYIFLL